MTETATTTTRSLERRLEFRAAPDKVWRALTDPTELSAWFGTSAELRPEAGAPGWIDFGPEDGRFQLRVEAVEPGRHLAWRWARERDVAVDDGPSTLVEWWVDAGAAGGTVLRLRESGFVEERDLDMNTYGWLDELSELADHLATEPWQRPIRRKLELRSDRERVWRALTDPTELAAWWGALSTTEIRPGLEGWFEFEVHGRRAFRVEAMDEPRYFAWSWNADEKDVPLAEARQVLRAEFVLWPREDGGTNLLLSESGFRGPESHADNSGGWDEELALLQSHLRESGSEA
jgi:uncharacterized protein YndB with AHSA1/START domain